MSGDSSVVDALNLSVIYENDEETINVDNEFVYNFYKIGENIDEAAMMVKIQLTEYRQILDTLNQHGAEHESMRCRLSKISQRKLIAQSKNKCHVCHIPINLENSSDFLTCSGCNHTICRNRHCAIWTEPSNDWNCNLCSSFQSGSTSACDWLISQLNEKLILGKGVDGNFHNKIVWDKSNSNDNSPLIPLEQREKVREFVEDLVSTLVGGSIDNAPVGQLYRNEECLPTGENETDSVDQSHTNLKHLVERIIEEVFKIPDLFDHSGVSSQPQRINLPQFDPKKYEELLATAVLNKIVESYNYERRFENSSGIHSGSDFESTTQTVFPTAQLETVSTSSSNEPRSDSSNSHSITEQPMSLTITNYIDNLSLEHSNSSPIDSPPQSPHSVGSNEEAYLSDYIQKHTVPLPTIDTNAVDSDSLDDDDYQSLNSNEAEGNWQENWLFKKRKLKNETATAIGMLVPSPMEEVKALIGDKTTDEVSDLSEAGSDLDDDDEKVQVNGRNSADFPHALIDSKTIIGGKNDVGSFDEAKTIDELLQPDSLVSMQSIGSQSPVIMEAKNDLILLSENDSTPVVLKLSENVDSNGNSERASDVVLLESQKQESTEISGSEKSKLAEVTKNDIQKVQGNIGALTEEPPIPTPRRKSKSLEASKRASSIEILTTKKSLSIDTKPINDSILMKSKVSEIQLTKVESKSSSLEDELLDSSINDIFQSIEGISNTDYQALVAEHEKLTNDAIQWPNNQPVILTASNPLVEDCLDETTQEICSEKVTTEPLNMSVSNVPNESYICKVAPTEYDLSMDNAFNAQSKPDILDVLLPIEQIKYNTVPKAVYISSKPALIAAEIAHQSTTVIEAIDESSVKNDQTPSIPTLIISKIVTDTDCNSPPVVNNNDETSLKPKKVLKAQDSLELPKDERDKFEPAKRVDSFETDDVGRIDAKLGALENMVNSVAEYVKNNPEDSLEVEGVELQTDVENDESFIILTEEEVEALKIEEKESLKKSDDQMKVGLDIDSLTAIQTLETSLLIEPIKAHDSADIAVNRNERYRTYANIQVSTSPIGVKKLSTSQSVEKEEEIVSDASESNLSTSTRQSSTSPELTTPSSVETESLKTPELLTPTRESSRFLPTIGELTTQIDTVTQSDTSTTSKLFTTNETINLSSATNMLQLNEFGDLPGSIAEREHLKWKNAQDIPNNPYSAEALQRRLSQTKNQSKVIDISHLATKQIDDPSLTADMNNGKPLQIVLGAGMPDHLRYGRDYYINDAKSARGTRKKTPSYQQYSSTEEDNIPTSKPTTPDSDVFTAKIVQIKEDLDHLSDDSTKLKLSISNNSSSSVQSDSLTLSDDSESTRVYDLRKNETVYLRNDIIRTSRNPIGTSVTPPPTPSDGDITLTKNLDQFLAIKQLNQLKQLEEEQHPITSQTKSHKNFTGSAAFNTKPLSPDTVKFLAPKPKPVFTSKIKMEEVISIKPLVLERENKDIPQNGGTEKTVIEEDVISSLPSVKALARSFLENNATENPKPPIQRPKSFTWQVSKENGNSNNGFVKEPSPVPLIPSYESNYHPVAVGHSITARSLSTKFREELKHSISDDRSNGSDNIEIVERQRDHSPDRPPSPVLLKGILKDKISFFKNLETK